MKEIRDFSLCSDGVLIRHLAYISPGPYDEYSNFAVACLTQTERVSDDVTRKMGPLDFTECPNLKKNTSI